MNKEHKKHLNLALLFVFLSIILVANFFHTEKYINNNKFCPVCHFQNSALSTCQINFFYLSQLSLLEILKTVEKFNYTTIFTPDLNAPLAKIITENPGMVLEDVERLISFPEVISVSKTTGTAEASEHLHPVNHSHYNI